MISVSVKGVLIGVLLIALDSACGIPDRTGLEPDRYRQEG